MTRVLIESGEKKVFATALDWPGWSRSAKSEPEALETLEDYVPRYQKVVQRAGLTRQFAERSRFYVVQRITDARTAEIDFGVPANEADMEAESSNPEVLEPLIALLRASWEEFDQVRARVSPELKKGPRGGGRDRDKMVDHVLQAEESYFRRLGIPGGKQSALKSGDVESHRRQIVDALEHFAKSGEPVRGWSLRYLIRRATWHVLDHAWEMEDKDLS